MEQTPNILILILSTQDHRYNDFIRACNSTWVQRAGSRSIRCLFYQGGASGDHLVNNTLHLSTDDSLSGTARKLLKAFEFIEHEGFDYDYIFRTNLSSYVYVENLVSFVRQHEDDNLYAGLIGSYNSLFSFTNRFDFLRRVFMIPFRKYTLKFASGSGFLISSGNVRKVLADTRKNLKLMDDVMIGDCLSHHGVPIIPAPRIDMNDDYVTYSKDIIACPDLIRTCHHVRLKSKDRSVDVDRFFFLDKYESYPVNGVGKREADILS